jgi:hypothetical protein
MHPTHRSSDSEYVVSKSSTRVLTNIIVEPHERPYKLPISLHDDPDSGVDTSVDEFCDERLEQERVGAGRVPSGMNKPSDLREWAGGV